MKFNIALKIIRQTPSNLYCDSQQIRSRPDVACCPANRSHKTRRPLCHHSSFTLPAFLSKDYSVLSDDASRLTQYLTRDNRQSVALPVPVMGFCCGGLNHVAVSCLHVTSITRLWPHIAYLTTLTCHSALTVQPPYPRTYTQQRRGRV